MLSLDARRMENVNKAVSKEQRTVNSEQWTKSKL